MWVKLKAVTHHLDGTTEYVASVGVGENAVWNGEVRWQDHDTPGLLRELARKVEGAKAQVPVAGV